MNILILKHFMPPQPLGSPKPTPTAAYVTLITMIITAAIGTAIAASVILLGLGASRSGFSLQQSAQARGLANACIEEAMQQLRSFTPFTGTGSLAMGQGSCNYTVISGGAQNRTATSSGTVGTVVRKVKAIINKINPAITVVSWQEVDSF